MSMEDSKVISYPLLQEFAKAIVEAMKREGKIAFNKRKKMPSGSNSSGHFLFLIVYKSARKSH